MSMTAARRVSNGVRWLDKNVPGWEDRITLPVFDIKHACNCVCGQIFKEDAAENRPENWENYSGFDYACDHYEVGAIPEWRVVSWAVHHGFDSDGAPGDGLISDYAELQAEWVRVIKKRQDACVAV